MMRVAALLRDTLPADACEEAITWLGTRRSAARAWADCVRGDWMLWLLARLGADRRQLVLAACACARLSLHRVPAGEDRPRRAIETAEAWARGEVTIKEVRRAAYATSAYATSAYADAAYADADADADYAADYAAAYAAYAAYAAAYAAYATSAYATSAYADAAYAAAAAAADAAAAYVSAAYVSERESALARCADIVRQHFPGAPGLRRSSIEP